MDGAALTNSWVPLQALSSRLSLNLHALSSRYPQLAQDLRSLTPQASYYILPGTDQIRIGIKNGQVVAPLPQTLTPMIARDVIRQMYPAAACNQPALVTGEDMGWLWNGLYNLPCQSPAAPGHRSPLFFVMRDVERLWVILHLHDWQKLLSDARVRLFTGEDALNDFRRSLVDDPACPWPRLCVQIDKTMAESGLTLDQILGEATAKTNQTCLSRVARFSAAYANRTPEMIVSQLTSGRPLKVLGITSRFTTFLQYSMRDWLAAFERMGHKTELFIESYDHEVCNGLGIAAACARFLPDLVIIIDHYRTELRGIPEQIPVVMWVQDALPNIFRKEAGVAQGPLDYCLGFARLRMVQEFGYPADRYMPAVVGCNEERFQPRELSATERSQFACDISFVSHASVPAEVILKEEIDRAKSPAAGKLLGAIFDELKGIYDHGGIVTEPIQIERMIRAALERTKTSLHPDDLPKLCDLFVLRINNAMFRHQSLHWLAEMDIDLRLFGRGWEKHPKLAKFARGVADNDSQLPLIYRASRISLHVSPHGAVHQRVIEGLASGGFFMIRQCPGDLLEREMRLIWEWCVASGVETEEQLRATSEPAIQAAIRRVADMLQMDPFQMQPPFLETLRASAAGGYLRSAGTVWNEDYDSIAYNSAVELKEKVTRFLVNPDERRRIANSMRNVVLERFTYLATTRRLLRFIADDLAGTRRQKLAG